MKFLILSQYAGAPPYGMVLRNYNWAKALTDMGHEVTVIGSAYSHYRAKQPPSNGNLHQEEIDGVKFIWLKGLSYDGKSNLKRLISMAQYCVQVFGLKKSIKTQFDVVVASSPHPFVVFPAVRLAKKLKAKFIYDIRDLWPLTPIHLGGFSPKHPLIKFMQKAEDMACKKADIITSVPENAKEYLMSRGMHANKFLAVGNGIISIPEAGEALSNDALKQVKDFKDKHDFVITHPGAMGRANALHILINVMSKLPKSIGCILLGDGPLKTDLQNQIDQMGLEDRVLIMDSIPLKQMPAFLSMMDAGYCGLLDSPLYKNGASPTKLNDYMMAHLPVIYGAGYKNSSIEQASCGYICKPENLNDIADKIQRLAELSQQEREEMGDRGYDWVVRNHMVSAQMDKILKKLSDIQ